MSANTAIEWADDTVNFWWGCTKVSSGCTNCYAEGISNRFAGGNWGPKGKRRILTETAVTGCELMQRRAARTGRRRVFVNSMSDFFEDRPELVAPRVAAFRTFDSCPDLDFLLLTKRPENVRRLWVNPGGDRVTWCDSRANVWIGASVENQATADERLPHLIECPAPVRFISVEPLLGPINLGRPMPNFDGAFGLGLEIEWIICGGESGQRARPSHPEWFYEIRDQADQAGVPFFFKQWGRWAPRTQVADQLIDWATMPHLWINYQGDTGVGPRNVKPPSGCLFRIGKKKAGRILDGETWDQMPVDVLAKPGPPGHRCDGCGISIRTHSIGHCWCPRCSRYMDRWRLSGAGAH